MDHRRMARLASVALLLPLAGCSLRGEVWLEPDATARVDLVLAYESGSEFASVAPCSQDPGRSTLASPPVPAAPGYVACHLTGRTTLDGDTLEQWGIAVASPDHLFVRTTRPWYLRNAGEVSDLDVLLHFPGDVIAASRGVEVTGSTARLNDPVAAGDGIAVTARSRLTLPSWLVPLLAGLGWGIALALGASWWSGWLGDDEDPAPALPDDREGPAPDEVPPSEGAPADRQDPSIWAPE